MPRLGRVLSPALLSRPPQLSENLGALDILDKLTPEILAKIEDIIGSKPQGLSTAEKNAAAGRGVGSILGS
jgi:hypothetical protein